MKNFIFLLFLSIASFSFSRPFDILEASEQEAFWNSDPVLFVKNNSDAYFSFTSENRDCADTRYYGGVLFSGLPAFETRVYFAEGGGISRIEVILFTKGGAETFEFGTDAQGRRFRRSVRIDKDITRSGFFELLEKIRGFLDEGSKSTPPVKTEKIKNKSAYVKSQVWKKTKNSTCATLMWSYSQRGQDKASFSPGFIRVSIDGPKKLSVPSKISGAKVAKSEKKISENVIKDSRGDVFIDNVPMVDQGQKGYCAAATAERVLKYYGLDVDEHEVAEAAGTTAEGGTEIRAMKNAIEAIGKKYHLATSVIYGDFDADVRDRIDNIEDEVKNYNKAAKKLNFPQIEDSVYIKRTGNVITYSPCAARSAMKAEVLKDMKVNGPQRSKYMKFLSEVRKQISLGVPVLWSLELGIYPEPGLMQSRGGHMRLIIGYNDKKKELLYSDSWGAGHELNRMPADWAFSVTRSAMYMKPTKR